jgi:AcrR family transcriptional regulator
MSPEESAAGARDGSADAPPTTPASSREAGSGAARPVPLDRERIAVAALALLDAGGEEAVTMRAIAERLGVRAPSLYNHVRSKDALLELVADRVVSGVDASGFATLPWDLALRRWAWSYYDALAAHPNLVPYVAANFGRIDASLRRAEQVYRGLLAAGWSPSRATRIAAAVRYAVLGAAVGSFAGGFDADGPAVADRFPALREAGRQPERRDAIDRAALELLLERFLDGLGAPPPVPVG